MTPGSQNGLGDLDRVLIVAPYRKDAVYTCALVHEHGIRGEATTAADLADRLSESPGVLVVTHEALDPNVIAVIGQFLQTQPNWSEIPIIVLIDQRAAQSRIQAALSKAWPRSRQIFYQRPVAALELVSGIQSALLTRYRQREMRDYLDRETELRLELNHRVKNILASVMSIFAMTRRGATTTEGLAEDFNGRLAALANVHSTVFLAGGARVALADVVASTLAPYPLAKQSGIRTGGPYLSVSRMAATTLALCLHELATNSIKYGALSQPEGVVDVIWELTEDADPILTIKWTETGGPLTIKPSRIGYGTRYVRSALAGLFGNPPDFEFADSGLICTIRGPSSRLSQE